MAFSLSFSKSILVLIFICDKVERGETNYLSARAMSEVLDIPKPTLIQILGHLNAAGILHTKEGAGGGVRLAKSPDQITLLDMLTAIERNKPLFQTEYQLKAQGVRPDSAKAVVDAALLGAEAKLRDELAATTLQDLLDRR